MGGKIIVKGNNIIVILMNGDINGDVNSKEGDVVLIKGDINGDVEANKVICQQPKSEYENYIDKLSSVEKLSKPDKEDEVHCICAKPNTNCAKCAWYDYVEQECKSWDANEGECQFIDKYESKEKLKDSLAEYLLENPIAPIVRCADCKFMEDTSVTVNGLSHRYCNCSNEGGLGLFDKYAERVCVCFKKKEPPPDYVDCADCAYGEIYSTTPNGCDYYKCSKFDGVMRSDGARICDSFKQKEF